MLDLKKHMTWHDSVYLEYYCLNVCCCCLTCWVLLIVEELDRLFDEEFSNSAVMSLSASEPWEELLDIKKHLSARLPINVP